MMRSNAMSQAKKNAAEAASYNRSFFYYFYGHDCRSRQDFNRLNLPFVLLVPVMESVLATQQRSK